MARREVDTSRAKCDRCGKPYQPGDAFYTPGDRWEEGDDGEDVLVSFRHWECHKSIEESFAELRKGIDDASKKLHGALDAIRRHLK